MAWWQDDLDDQQIGEFRIEEKIGEGGMAEVFRVRRIRDGEISTYALKVPKIGRIPPDDLQQVLRRFQRERRLHGQGEPIPHIVTLTDAGEITDRNGTKRPYLVLQYLGGGSLGSRLEGIPGRRTHTQTLGEVIRWLRPVATALDHLHSAIPPRLHRDIKPDNILFNKAGSPFLSDFGIATTLEEIQTETGSSESGSTLSSVGGSPGSPGYQSPESFAGMKTPESDQFSLAVTVYEALSGRLPTRASNRDTYIAEITKWAITPLSEVCPELPKAATDAVMKAMSREVQDRYITCEDFAQALEWVARSPGSTTSRVTPNVETKQGEDNRSGQAGSGSKEGDVSKRNGPGPSSGTSRETRKGGSRRAWSAAGIALTIVGVGTAWYVKIPPIPSTGTLLVETDALCRLAVDDQPQGTLAASNSRRQFELAPGGHAATCISTERPEIGTAITVDVQQGHQSNALLELKSKIDAAKAGDLRKAEEKAKVEAKPSEEATLLVQADAPCKLKVNGEDKSVIGPDKTVTVKATAGDQFVECTSTEIDSVQVREVKTLERGRQSVALLELASRVAASRQAEAAAKAVENAASAANTFGTADPANENEGSLTAKTHGTERGETDVANKAIPSQGRQDSATNRSVIDPVRAQALNRQGEEAYHSNNLEASIDLYKQAIDLDPTSGMIYSNLALAYRRTNRQAEAIWASQKAIALASGATAATVRASSYYNIGRTYEAAGQFGDALRNYQAAKREKENPVYDNAIKRVGAQQP